MPHGQRSNTGGLLRTAGGIALAAALVAGAPAAGAAFDSASETESASEPPRAEMPNLTTVKDSITEYHDSGQWHDDIAERSAQAREHLERALRGGVDDPAIVLDIDDTSVSTYPYQRDHDYGYVDEAFDEYVHGGAFPANPPVRRLARFAAERGVAVFFVTGRDESPRMRHDTLHHLREQGYPDPAGLYLQPPEDDRPSVVPYKSGARADIESRGYDIVVNVGDQRSDLRGGHAREAVKLPNPVYRID
ncbi:HAD family acid phosphatase [Salinifilum aidingensis]